jgi:hypothetical protein
VPLASGWPGWAECGETLPGMGRDVGFTSREYGQPAVAACRGIPFSAHCLSRAAQPAQYSHTGLLWVS